MRLPRPRWRLRTTLVLVALCAAALGAWQAYHRLPLVGWARRLRGDRHAYDRWEAARLIAQYATAPDARLAVPALLDGLNDPDAVVRRESAGTLGHFAADGARIVPALGRATRDPMPAVRWAAVSSLEQLVRTDPRLAAAADPHLAAAMRGGDRPLGLRAALMLVEHRRSPDATEALRLILRGDDDDAHLETIRHLSFMPADAVRPLVPDLLRLLESGDEWARVSTAHALRQLERGRVIPVLIEVMRTGSSQARLNALYTLGEVRPPALEAVPAMLPALKDPDATTRMQAIQALQAMGARDEVTVAALLASARDRDPLVRWSALHAIRQLGPRTLAVRDALARALRDDNPEVREVARAVADPVEEPNPDDADDW